MKVINFSLHFGIRFYIVDMLDFDTLVKKVDFDSLCLKVNNNRVKSREKVFVNKLALALAFSMLG